MRKLLFLFSTALVLSCSGSDDNQTTNTVNEFHPPTWIQGKWGQDFGDGQIVSNYNFTSNDVCQITGAMSFCWLESLSPSIQAGGNVSINESISDTEYTTGFSGSGSSISVKFIKISSTKIQQVSELQNITLVKIQ